MKIEQELYELISISKLYIDTDAYEEVLHFYNHGEYEMSLEGLLIELCANKLYPKGLDALRLINLAKHFKLDEESVFDYRIWEKVLLWKDNKEG